jgi:hypothetical protein
VIDPASEELRQRLAQIDAASRGAARLRLTILVNDVGELLDAWDANMGQLGPDWKPVVEAVEQLRERLEEWTP